MIMAHFNLKSVSVLWNPKCQRFQQLWGQNCSHPLKQIKVNYYNQLLVIIFRQFQTKFGYCVLRPPSSAAVACTIRLAVMALVVEAAPIKTLDFR